MKLGTGDIPVSSLGKTIKSLTVNGSHSKRENVSRSSIEFGIGRIAAWQDVNENDVYDHSFSRYRRSDSVSVLREIHRRYPKDTELILVRGLWTLIPVQRGVP